MPALLYTLFGPSGAGKSTWARSLARDMAPFPNGFARLDFQLITSWAELEHEIAQYVHPHLSSTGTLILDEADKIRRWGVGEHLERLRGLPFARVVLLARLPLGAGNIPFTRNMPADHLERFVIITKILTRLHESGLSHPNKLVRKTLGRLRERVPSLGDWLAAQETRLVQMAYDLGRAFERGTLTHGEIYEGWDRPLPTLE